MSQKNKTTYLCQRHATWKYDLPASCKLVSCFYLSVLLNFVSFSLILYKKLLLIFYKDIGY